MIEADNDDYRTALIKTGHQILCIPFILRNNQMTILELVLDYFLLNNGIFGVTSICKNCNQL